MSTRKSDLVIKTNKLVDNKIKHFNEVCETTKSCLVVVELQNGVKKNNQANKKTHK